VPVQKSPICFDKCDQRFYNRPRWLWKTRTPGFDVAYVFLWFLTVIRFEEVMTNFQAVSAFWSHVIGKWRAR
jgi:hypothetical protein